MVRWGVVATVKASERDILNFAAYHLRLGAHRLYLYLDAPEQVVFERLRVHPRIRVIACDENWWKRRNGRPEKHQSRQFANARHAYNRRTEVDWLAHIDVDEFLWPARPIADQLAALPGACLCARVRPIESMVPPSDQIAARTVFKAFHLDLADRQRAAKRIFPAFGAFLSGGFLSHVAGKLFYRTGVEGLQARIHNVVVKGQQNPGEVALLATELCHFHAQNWEGWLRQFRYRMKMGSYRSELPPQVGRKSGGVSMHHLFSKLEAENGEAGLRAFFDEVCVAHPRTCQMLQEEGLLRRLDLQVNAARAAAFPGS